MEESRSPYETYILSQNIEYLPDYSIGEDDSGYEEDEVSASDLLKLETVFIFRCPEGYKAEQILESTGITLPALLGFDPKNGFEKNLKEFCLKGIA